jgi:uncharacterized protein (DUF1778 family)
MGPQTARLGHGHRLPILVALAVEPSVRQEFPTLEKSHQIKIRASAVQMAKIMEAARLLNMGLGQFMLASALDSAEVVMAHQRPILVSMQEFDWLLAKLDEPPKEIPAIRELLARPSVFED